MINVIAVSSTVRYEPLSQSAAIALLRFGIRRCPVIAYSRITPSMNKPEPISEKIMYRAAASVVRPICRIIRIPQDAIVQISMNTYPVNRSFVYDSASKATSTRSHIT